MYVCMYVCINSLVDHAVLLVATDADQTTIHVYYYYIYYSNMYSAVLRIRSAEGG